MQMFWLFLLFLFIIGGYAAASAVSKWFVKANSSER
jgi:hypothetical protein